jgi:hypothetical protein
MYVNSLLSEIGSPRVPRFHQGCDQGLRNDRPASLVPREGDKIWQCLQALLPAARPIRPAARSALSLTMAACCKTLIRYTTQHVI